MAKKRLLTITRELDVSDMSNYTFSESLCPEQPDILPPKMIQMVLPTLKYNYNFGGNLNHQKTHRFGLPPHYSMKFLQARHTCTEALMEVGVIYI